VGDTLSFLTKKGKMVRIKQVARRRIPVDNPLLQPTTLTRGSGTNRCPKRFESSKSSPPFLRKMSFARLVGEVGGQVAPGLRFDEMAINQLHRCSETFLDTLLNEAKFVAGCAGRTDLVVRDIRIACLARGIDLRDTSEGETTL